MGRAKKAKAKTVAEPSYTPPRNHQNGQDQPASVSGDRGAASALRIEYRPLASLTAYAQNARTHSPEQIEQLKSSILQFGWTNPILVDVEGLVIAGHGRMQAASDLGIEEVPTICIAGLTDVQKRALIIADNKLALNAGWDDALLTSELGALQGVGLDFGAIGFSEQELGAILEEREQPDYAETVETPIYSPKEPEAPPLASLVDRTKADGLVAEIEEAGIDADVKRFLVQAAQRHTRFDYHQIAEYYCHAPAEVQRLMERSALVIIDYDKAIENGYACALDGLAALSGAAAGLSDGDDEAEGEE